VLHRLALVQADGLELWRWNGDVKIFVDVAGLTFRSSADGLLLLALNDDPRFELAVPKVVLARLAADDSLVVELTPRPLLGVVSEVLRQNDRLIAELRAGLIENESIARHSLSAGTMPESFHLSIEIENIASLLKNSLARHDQTIAQQSMKLKKMREELMRAEAQLDLLKDIILGDREEAVKAAP
jgi:hypothetical protein